MTTKVVYATEDMPLSEVAELMATNQISGLPVLNGQIVTGVISEKDFLFVMSKGTAGTFMGVIRECLLGRSCLAAPVRLGKAADIMSSPVTTVQSDTPILEAATLMSTGHINRLPVVDSAGKLQGIVTRSDALSWSVSV
jgi:CBS domain-containing protein